MIIPGSILASIANSKEVNNYRVHTCCHEQLKQKKRTKIVSFHFSQFNDFMANESIQIG